MNPTCPLAKCTAFSTIKKNQSPSIIDKSLTIKFQVPTIAFNHQVHVLVGSYNPIIFQHPCINIPGCLYNSKENMIQITIQTIEVGTYTLKIIIKIDGIKTLKIVFIASVHPTR